MGGLTLHQRLSVVAELPGSPLQIGAALDLAPASVAAFLNELREAGHAMKLNRTSYAMRDVFGGGGSARVAAPSGDGPPEAKVGPAAPPPTAAAGLGLHRGEL